MTAPVQCGPEAPQRVAFAPIHNRPGINPKTGKPWADATGAFLPEARAFLAAHGQPAGDLCRVDNSKRDATMRAAVFAALDRCEPGSVCGVALFCHGFRSGVQFGIRSADVGELAKRIARCGTERVRVTLYACDAARDDDRDRKDDTKELGGDGGFADLLRDALCSAGRPWCVVDAHTTAAHTTKNPDVRRFEGLGSAVGGAGGYYIVPRRSSRWRRWSAALRTPFRFEFPYLTTAQILERLSSP